MIIPASILFRAIKLDINDTYRIKETLSLNEKALKRLSRTKRKKENSDDSLTINKSAAFYPRFEQFRKRSHLHRINYTRNDIYRTNAISLAQMLNFTSQRIQRFWLDLNANERRAHQRVYSMHFVCHSLNQIAKG